MAHDPRPTLPFQLATRFDAREWASEEVFRLEDIDDGEGVVLPSSSLVWLNAVHFLSGNGNAFSLAQRFSSAYQSLGGVANAITFTITTNDYVQLIFTGAGQTLQVLDTEAFRLLGWPSGLGPSGPGVYTAPLPWTRGTFRLAEGNGPPLFQIKKSGNISTYSILISWCQDVPSLIRGGVTNDINTPPTSLSKLATTRYVDVIRMGVTPEGRAWISGLGNIGDLTWVNSEIRDALGFTSLQSMVTETVGGNTISYMVGAGELGVLSIFPSAIPLSTKNMRLREQTKTADLVNGRMASNHLSSFRQYIFDWVAVGPGGQSTQNIYKYLHWRENHTYTGQIITLYQNAGDSRRSLDPGDTVGVSDNSLLYVSSEEDFEGALIGAGVFPADESIQFDDRGLRRFVDMQFTLQIPNEEITYG